MRHPYFVYARSEALASICTDSPEYSLLTDARLKYRALDEIEEKVTDMQTCHRSFYDYFVDKSFVKKCRLLGTN